MFLRFKLSCIPRFYVILATSSARKTNHVRGRSPVPNRRTSGWLPIRRPRSKSLGPALSRGGGRLLAHAPNPSAGGARGLNSAGFRPGVGADNSSYARGPFHAPSQAVKRRRTAARRYNPPLVGGGRFGACTLPVAGARHRSLLRAAGRMPGAHIDGASGSLSPLPDRRERHGTRSIGRRGVMVGLARRRYGKGRERCNAPGPCNPKRSPWSLSR